MNIDYKINAPISTQQFIDVLKRSTLAGRRPVDDATCIGGMLEHSQLLVSAWHNERLVGVARSITDFHYACYLSDLAVDDAYQKQGIGKQLQIITQDELGEHCKLILLAAPDAHAYYGELGYTAHSRCWVLAAGDEIKA